MAAGQAPMELPLVCQIMGRTETFENNDINGEYSFVKNFGGYPAYLNRSTGMGIRFQSGRWVIDRHGIQDREVCVAFATPLTNCGRNPSGSHPANPDLVWHVWDSRAQSHMEDPKVIAIDAPQEVCFAGRACDRDNALLNGKYTLATTAHGRALYRHQTDDLIMSYRLEEQRWIIQESNTSGSNICLAWATAGIEVHPAEPSLQWQFWEAQVSTFVHDPRAGVVDAPMVINLYGRDPRAENARINGAYRLAGLHAGRPLYEQPGVGVIRYSPKNNWWLIDCDDLQSPSLMTRMTRLITGDGESAYDRCSAWCNALDTKHPGHADLQWLIWCSVGQSHHPDVNVVTTTAPQRVQVSGRDARLENADINGEYALAQFYDKRPVYQKAGTHVNEPLFLYFCKKGTWAFDRSGELDTGVCVAFADGQISSENPVSGRQTWKVYEASRGGFVTDSRLSVSAICDEAVPNCDQMDQFGGVLPSANVAGRGMKRRHDAESLAQSPQQKHARVPNQGGSWLHDVSRRVFGA